MGKGVSMMLCVALAAPVAWAQEAAPSTAPTAKPAAATCPAPSLLPPRYPPELLVARKQGTVLLDLTIDECGTVRQVAVKSRSGRKKLDEAAVAAAGQWVLPASERLKAVNGHVERPVNFSFAPDSEVPYAKLDWPKSHKRPRYVLEPVLADYATAEAAAKATQVPVEQTLAPPYAMQGQFYRHGTGQPQEYWLFLYKNYKPNLAARYRLVTENNEPVVRLAVLCDDAPEACGKAREFLLKGLPFARP